MNGAERRKRILRIMSNEHKPVSGTKLAQELKVSRQVIVQDIALLRAEGYEIFSTNRGYCCKQQIQEVRVFYVCHEEEQIAEELNLIVDNGAKVQDVFVRHEIYGEIRADLSVDSRKKVKEFVQELKSGKSTPLSKITSSYHYHTVTAESLEILDAVEQELREYGFLCE